MLAAVLGWEVKHERVEKDSRLETGLRAPIGFP